MCLVSPSTQSEDALAEVMTDIINKVNNEIFKDIIELLSQIIKLNVSGKNVLNFFVHSPAPNF